MQFLLICGFFLITISHCMMDTSKICILFEFKQASSQIFSIYSISRSSRFKYTKVINVFENLSPKTLKFNRQDIDGIKDFLFILLILRVRLHDRKLLSRKKESWKYRVAFPMENFRFWRSNRE